MPVVFDRYEPNHEEFGKLMMGQQTRDLAHEGAKDALAAAKRFAPNSDEGDGDRYVDHFSIEDGIPISIPDPWNPSHPNLRMTSRVVNDSEYAVAIEFGDTGLPRKQGGNAGPAQRPLGRAGAAIGDYKGGPPK